MDSKTEPRSHGYGHLSWLEFEEPVIINTLEDFVKLKAQLDELSERYGRQLAKSMEKTVTYPGVEFTLNRLD